MVDIVTPQIRSRMMAGIRGKDTRPELLLRRGLHAEGLRFRLHRRDLPGRPDLVLARHRLVIFVHGCFWHRHPGCHYAAQPASRPEFWRAKFAANTARDARAEAGCLALGWNVARVWECGLKHAPEAQIASLLARLAAAPASPATTTATAASPWLLDLPEELPRPKA